MKYIALIQCGFVVLGVAACSPGKPAQNPINDTQPPATDPGSGDFMGAKEVTTPVPNTAPEGSGASSPPTTVPPTTSKPPSDPPR